MSAGSVAKGRAYLAIGGGCVLLSIAYLALALRLPFGEMDAPGAGLFPLVAGGVLLATSLAAMCEGWRMPAERVAMPRGVALRRVSTVFFLLLGYVVVLPLLGQALTAFLFCALLVRLLSTLPWPRVLLLAAAMSASLYLAFVTLLQVPLPRGLLLPW